jgi:two-component system, NarL family, invasion response regulator UvrY
MVNAILVDSHEMVRYGVKCALTDVKDINVVGEAANGDAALSLMRKLKPEMVLLDLKLPGISGIEITRKALLANPDAKVIIMNACNDPILAHYALQAGASAYLTKTESPESLISAVKKVCAGQTYITPEVAQNIAMQKINGGDENPIRKLSGREIEVVLMVTQGYSVQEIAEKLYLSPKTVNTYRYRVFSKLEIKNNVELTHLVLRYGILEQEAANMTDEVSVEAA